jgi:hypothetical protein
MFDDLEIRYHFPDEIELDVGERVFLEKQVSGTCGFVRCGVAPEDARDMKSIRALVRHTALARGGEAWRVVTERGELLCVFSVEDLAEELSGKAVITLHPYDQLCLAVARLLMGLAAH